MSIEPRAWVVPREARLDLKRRAGSRAAEGTKRGMNAEMRRCREEEG
jgi:hypothetical protein